MINGRKRWPGNAVWCDYIIVFARDVTDKQVKAFVVEKGNPGYKATKIVGKVSLRMVQNADITLTDCRVLEDARLQNCNSFKDCAKVLMGTRNAVAWGSLGNAVSAYDIALTYARRRIQHSPFCGKLTAGPASRRSARPLPPPRRLQSFRHRAKSPDTRPFAASGDGKFRAQALTRSRAPSTGRGSDCTSRCGSRPRMLRWCSAAARQSP